MSLIKPAAGIQVLLMETRQVKAALSAMPIKTEPARRARDRAALVNGWFRPVHCKSASAQEVRALLTARKMLQKKMLTSGSGASG